MPTSKENETTNETTTETTTQENYTHISVVLDRSGSMESTAGDTIGGFNQFINDQKAIGGRASLTLVQFDDVYELLKDMQLLENIDELTKQTYIPRGCTALLDAVGKTINHVDHQISALSDKPNKIIFVIITDGLENASREFNRNQIFEMIRRHESENNWQFIFIGANQDAIAEANTIGIRAGNSLSYGANQGGTRAMYASVSANMTQYRTGSLENVDYFSENDRAIQQQHGAKVATTGEIIQNPPSIPPKEPEDKEPEDLSFYGTGYGSRK